MYPLCPLGMTSLGLSALRLGAFVVRRAHHTLSLSMGVGDIAKLTGTPTPRGRVSNPPLRIPIFFAAFAFFAAILLFYFSSRFAALQRRRDQLAS